MMNAGRMIHVVTLDQPHTDIDENRTPVTTWSTFATLRAELIERGAAETVGDRGAEDIETVKLRTWFAPGVTAKLRLTFDGLHFNIRAIRPIGNNEGLEIEADRIGGVE